MASITRKEGDLPLSERPPVNIFPKLTADSLWKVMATIHCTPVTLPTRDLQGRTLQLWKYKDALRGTITDSEGNVRCFSGRKIRNPCNPTEKDPILLRRLESDCLKQWQLGYSSRSGEIYVFPYLKAAGKKDPHYVPKQIKQIQECIPGIKDHFKPSDLKGAEEELRGTVVAWKAVNHRVFGRIYRPYQHYKEVRETQDNCSTLLERLKKLHCRGDLTPEERDQIQELRKHIFRLREESYKFAPHGKQPPKGFEFREPLQLNHLTDSYNGSNPKSPIPARGGSGGSIGGVGNDVGIIEGLFDTTQDLEENLHDFYIPSVDGKMPFSQKELQQILRELALGIYVHETVPFFSLHFNFNSNMYPVIHPVYEHTLVGRVISLLDYYMKGFLNGGFYEESFLHEWHIYPIQETGYLKRKCIDLHNYCKKHLGNEFEYASVREIIDNCKLNISALENVANKGREAVDAFVSARGLGDAGHLLFDTFLGKPDPEIFSDYSGFRSSFRIIAKQNSIRKSGNLFELDGDFDVFYTIEPDPSYEEALQKYRYQYGGEPPGYLRLVNAYELMRHQIRTVMPKLPLFSELFEQLKVINFFCYYLKTLKKAQKIPIFSKKELSSTLGCPPLFPHLPIRKMKSEKVEVNFGKIFQKMPLPDRQKLETYFFSEENAVVPPIDVTDSVLQHFRLYLQESIKTFSLSQEKEFIERHRIFIIQFLMSQRKSVQDLKCRRLSNEEQQRYDAISAQISAGNFDPTDMQEQDTELLTRLTLNGAKEKLLELKEIEKNILKSIAVAEKRKNKCYNAIEKIDQGYLCNKSRREIKGDLKEAREYLSDRKWAFRSIQSEIVRINECSLLVDLFSHDSIPYVESKAAIEFYSEQPEEESEENKRIVGGCGLNLKNLPVTTHPIEISLLSQMVSKLAIKNDEELVPVIAQGETKAKGHAFRLHLADFPAASNKDYQWLSFFKTQEEEKHLGEKREFINTILFEDLEFVQKTLPYFKSPHFKSFTVDLQGIHAVHHAAAAESPAFLKGLVENGHCIATLDPDGYLPLHYAAKAGRIDQIAYLCKLAPKCINDPSKSGITPLHLAVQYDQPDAVDLLLKLRANPNTQTTYGMSPLYSAVHNGHEKIALMLIQHESTAVDLAVEDKSTPLFVAIEWNLPHVVDALLKRGASFVIQRRDTYNPLHVAAKRGLLSMCRKLISAGADVNVGLKSGKTALHLASEGYPEIVELLLRKGADPSLTGWDRATPLMSALISGDTLSGEKIINFCAQSEAWKKILTHLDLKGESPLLVALARRQYSVVELLLRHNVSLDYTTELLILLCRAKIAPVLISQIISKAQVSRQELHKICLIAQEYGHNQFVSYLILFEGVKESNVPCNPNGWGLAAYAAQHDHIDVIKYHIKTAQDLIQLTKDGKSIAAIAAENNSCRSLKLLINAMVDRRVPLEKQFTGKHLLAAAVESGHIEAADVIIHKIFDPNLPLDQQKRMAAHFAAKNDDVEMLLLLRSRGARYDTCDVDGKTPIHYAIDYAHEEAIDYFLDQKHEITLPENMLRYAAQKGSASLINRLISRGFKVNEVDKQTHQTAIFWAISEDNPAAFEVLCKHGADLSQRAISGLTPLLLAARLGRTHFLLHLLAVTHAKQVGVQGETALHLTVQGGHEECVSLLLRSGFQSDTKQLDGKTPLDIAREMNFSHIQLLLEGKEDVLRNRKELIVHALQKGEMCIEELMNLIQGMPLNQPMVFKIEGIDQRIPLLHLIHKEACKEPFRKQAIQAFHKLTGVDQNVKCPKGRTPYHILAEEGRDFNIDLFHLFEPDQEGRTPLHLYAGHATHLQLNTCLKTPTNSIDVEDVHGMTPLLMSIVNKKLDNARVLLLKGANPNHTNAMLLTPLAAAVSTGQIEIVKLLLKQGAQINQCSSARRSTPLIQAVGQKEVNIAMLLIAEGGDVNQCNREGVAPVHAAASTGNLYLIRLLHSAGADLHVKDNHGLTVAHYAAQSDHPEMIDFLIAHGVSLVTLSHVKKKSARDKHHTLQGTTPFHLACQKGNEPMMRKLIQNGCNVEAQNEGGLSPLVYAAHSESKQALRLFRDYRVIEDSEQRTEAIQMSLVMDSASSLKEFYRDDSSANTPLDKRGRTALHYAALYGAHQCAIFLVQRGAELQKGDLDHKTPLDLAVQGKHLRLVRYLLQELETVDLDTEGDEKKPYLHQACESGDVELAALLIEQRASIEKVDFQGMRPIHIAAKQANYPLLHLLIAFGADFDAKTAEGLSIEALLPGSEAQLLVDKYRHERVKRVASKESLIHTAVALNDEAHISLLCKIDDINAQDANGRTPLHKATLEGNLSMVCKLVNLGANLDKQEASGLTAVQLAILNQKTYEIIQFFLETKADLTLNDKYGNSLLFMITQLPDKEYAHQIFSLVVDHLPKIQKDAPSNEMLAAIKEGNIVSFFNEINKGHPVENVNFSLLNMAIKDLNFTILCTVLDWLVPKGINIDYQDPQGVTALHLAVQNKSLKAVEMLIAKGAGLEFCAHEGNKTPLAFAVETSLEITSYLLEQGANPRAFSYKHTLLQVIADQNVTTDLTYEMRQMIFNRIYKFLPRTQISVVSTEMDMAIKKNQIDSFFNLINRGHPLFDGQLFLHAASQGALDIVKTLHNWFYADLKSENQEGYTPLHLAAMNGHYGVVVYLLHAGALANVANKKECTILFSIAQNKKLPNQKKIFYAIYQAIPKISEDLWNSRKIDDTLCFLCLNRGYPLLEVCQKAAEANCVFTVQTLHTQFPDLIDLKKLASIAESANAKDVIKYIELVSPNDCLIL